MKTAESNCPDCGCELCQCPNHIEDVRGRSMADAAVGPCDCDPHIEYCPSCAPYLHEPLKPAGEEDKATYKQIADNYTQPADCPRCAELQQDLQTTADALGHIQRQFEAVNQDRDDWIACHDKIFRKLQEANNTIAQQAKRIKELETKLTLFVSRG